MVHDLDWVTPAPFWRQAIGSPEAMRRPALLGFSSDAFMEELFGLLRKNPEDLAVFLTRPEQGGEPPTGGRAEPPTTSPTLRLYQPVHGRFYLVAASLVCRRVGLPDHRVDMAGGEAAGFVLRRLDGNDEHALLPADGGGYVWKKLGASDVARVAEGEEVLASFPVDFAEAGRPRRFIAGLIPVGKREALEGALFETEKRVDSAADGDFVADRMEELERRFFAPLAELRKNPVWPNNQKQDMEAAEKDASRFLLLDLADILATHLAPFWACLPNEQPTKAAANDLFQALGAKVAGASTPSFREALRAVWVQRDLVNGLRPAKPGEVLFDYDLGLTTLEPNAALRAAFEKALKAYAPASAPAPSAPSSAPAEGRYVVRCVLRRPPCKPAAPTPDDVVSEPSESFVLASYFDPDAPARPIRIPLPTDTSIAALRRFKKSVGFAMSADLRKKIQRSSDLNQLLKGKLAPEGPGGAEICSFSIPIITLCATIVLMIFVVLLNLIFFWLPFVRICLPMGAKTKG